MKAFQIPHDEVHFAPVGARFSISEFCTIIRKRKIDHLTMIAPLMLAMIGASIGLVLADVDPPNAQMTELKQLLIPFISSLLFVWSIMFLNPAVENRRVIWGRSLCAIVIGSIAPSGLALIHPSMTSLMGHSPILVATGGISAFLAYALSKPMAEKLFAKSDAMADHLIEDMEKRIHTGDQKK